MVKTIKTIKISERLHQRLTALGCNVSAPSRIWLGRAHDHSDYWRWEAREPGGSFIGSSNSMQECVKMSDAELKCSVEHSASGRSHFYRSYGELAAAIGKLKALP